MAMHVFKLTLIGLISGTVLASFMQIIYIITGNKAYFLLYNVDYIPLLHYYESSVIVMISFHFIFCILSIVILFYLLKFFHLEYHLLPYFLVYTIGAGILFFLTLLTKEPPSATNFFSWFYWTLGHVVYSLVVAFLIKYWVREKETS